MDTYCPDCEVPMVSGDSGEPDCIPGYHCPECGQFFSDEELAEGE